LLAVLEKDREAHRGNLSEKSKSGKATADNISEMSSMEKWMDSAGKV
jgi:hypothetical protein